MPPYNTSMSCHEQLEAQFSDFGFTEKASNRCKCVQDSSLVPTKMDSLGQVGSRVALPLGKVSCCAHLSGSLFGGALGTSTGPAGVGG